MWKYSLDAIFLSFHVSQKLQLVKNLTDWQRNVHALKVQNCGVLQELHMSNPEILLKSHFFQYLIKGIFFNSALQLIELVILPFLKDSN